LGKGSSQCFPSKSKKKTERRRRESHKKLRITLREKGRNDNYFKKGKRGGELKVSTQGKKNREIRCGRVGNTKGSLKKKEGFVS